MNQALDQHALSQLFLEAHTHNAWRDETVSDALLHQLHDLLRMAPTAMNACPARIIFVKSQAAKEKLMPALSEGNRAKTMEAPVTAIIGHDLKFYEQLPKLFPHAPNAGDYFKNNAEAAEVAAFRNGTLQGAYLIMAARALGLDCGPMSGFDHDKMDELFFAGTSIKSNFICNLGYGDPKGVFPRNPRFTFDEACSIA